MVKTIGAFSSLFLATLLLLIGSGLFNTYVGLRLTAASVSEVWVGAIIAAYYLGLVFGARVGHKLIIRVGHIRAYAATAALVTVTVLIQALIEELPLWIALRFVAGIAMVTQFIVLESWLNEQTENHLRGRVFAFYMVFSSLGTVLGQLSVGMFPALDTGPLMFVALCSAACLIPVAVTRRVHPAIQVPVPLHYKYYVSRVPMSMTVMFMAGMMSGAFYGLAPVYGVAQGMTAGEVAVFVAAAVASGLVFQWPVGWLADRISRVGLIRINSVLLAALTVPLWGWWPLPYPVLVVFSCLFGIILFTLYPIAAAFANDNVDPDRRVGLSAILYMVYGLGACVGPLLVGLLMRELHAGVFFVFVTACAVFLIVFVRTQRVSGAYLSQDAPTEFVPMPDSVQNPNVVPALDPRVDMATDVSFVAPPVEEAAPAGLQPDTPSEGASAEAVPTPAQAGDEDASSTTSQSGFADTGPSQAAVQGDADAGTSRAAMQGGADVSTSQAAMQGDQPSTSHAVAGAGMTARSPTGVRAEEEGGAPVSAPTSAASVSGVPDADEAAIAGLVNPDVDADAASAAFGVPSPGAAGVGPSDLLAMASGDTGAHTAVPKAGIEPVIAVVLEETVAESESAGKEDEDGKDRQGDTHSVDPVDPFAKDAGTNERSK